MDMVSLKSKRVSPIQTRWWKLGQLRAKNWVEKLIIIKRLIRQKKSGKAKHGHHKPIWSKFCTKTWDF